jgi:hypothetical protein
VLDALIALIELPEADAGGDDDDDGDDDAGPPTRRRLVVQPAGQRRARRQRSVLGDRRRPAICSSATRLCDFGRTHPGRLMPLVAQASTDAQQMLAQYAQAAGLQLA